MKHLAIALLFLCAASPARADDFDPLAFQVGLGFAIRAEHDPTFDGTVRFGAAWDVGHRLHAGGFIETHTLGFATGDVAVGPQLQRELGDLSRVQLRAGVGGGSDGPLALAGVQVAHAFFGISATGRRDLSTGAIAVSFDFEVQPLLVVLAALFSD